MKKIFLILFLAYGFISAQEIENPKLSGMLFADSHLSFDNIKSGSNNYDEMNIASPRSPLLAAVLSAAVPGAGEFYNEDYIKSALFVAVEAAAITIGLIYNKKGDDQTNFFQDFAEKNWSVKRYADWTVKNAVLIEPGLDPALLNIYDNNGNLIWKKLNDLESAIGHFYSHRLAYHGEQQYYEMIGKYQQFYQGWDDADPNLTTYDEIKAKLDAGGTNFIYYSHERGKANDFYNIASKAVIVIVTNHIISAIDAAWSVSRYNKNLHVSAQLQRFDIGYNSIYYPQLNLQYNF